MPVVRDEAPEAEGLTVGAVARAVERATAAQLQEALFEDFLHPRDRRGEFSFVGHGSARHPESGPPKAFGVVAGLANRLRGGFSTTDVHLPEGLTISKQGLDESWRLAGGDHKTISRHGSPLETARAALRLSAGSAHPASLGGGRAHAVAGDREFQRLAEPGALASYDEMSGASRVTEAVGRAVAEALPGEAPLVAAMRGTTPVPLKQRGRTGKVTAFDPGKHKRGEHGRFAYEGGAGAHATKKPLGTPAQIKQFQKEYGLEQTGKLDAATRATAAAPPPETVGGMAKTEADKKAKAEAAKRVESRAKTNARRKEEGKPPVGTKSSRSTGSRSGGTRSTGGGTTRGTSTRGSGSRSSAASTRAELEGEGGTRLGTGYSPQKGPGKGGTPVPTGRGSSRLLSTVAASSPAQAARALKIAGTEGAAMSPLLVTQDLKLGTGMSKGQPPSPAVGLLQAKLQALGFALGSGGVDGKFGGGTETAVRVLQKDYGLPATGVVEARTLQLIETLIQRGAQWQRRGIIASDRLPEEGIAPYVARVVAVLDA